MTLAKKLKTATVADILKNYDLPHRFVTYFYSQVAKDSCSKAKVTDPRSLKAIDISERFGNGGSFSESELKEVMDDASAYATSSASYATWAASCASAASYATWAATTAAYAYSSAYSSPYKPLLLKLIQTRLTKVERLIIFGVED